MGRMYLKYSKEFRESALRRLALTPNVAQLCRELGISRQLLYQWRETEQREQRKQSLREIVQNEQHETANRELSTLKLSHPKGAPQSLVKPPSRKFPILHPITTFPPITYRTSLVPSDFAGNFPLWAHYGFEVKKMDDNVPQPTPTEVAAEPLTDAAARRRAAVLRCCEGRIDAIKASLKSGLPRHPNLCHYDVAKGYCEALPDIVDSESTRDFIACVVYGMAISAIDVKQGSKLLYGAQVALSAYGRDT